MKKYIIILIFILSLFNACGVVSAENPFVTKTVNRFDEIVTTQDAYEPILKVKKIITPYGVTTLLNPSDIYVDDEDYNYIVDTGNKRIVIIDDEYQYVCEFGKNEYLKVNDSGELIDPFIKPSGIYVRDNLVYVADYGVETNHSTGKIMILEFNKELKTLTCVSERFTPSSKILEIDNFHYHPKKIAVDKNDTMYVVNEGSYNGVMTISKENRFMSYFAPNQVHVSLEDRLTRFLYGENDKVTLMDALPTEPYNVFIDDSGYIYTVTQTTLVNNLGDTLKKVNLGGLNFYPDDMESAENFVDCFSGSVGNVFACTKEGFIYEYDIEGNILFIFGGKSTTIDQLGLFKSLSGMAVRSDDSLVLLDQNDSSIQVFRPTDFANTLHTALGHYNNGEYELSKSYFEEVLKYNSFLDIAHKGIGMAYFLEGNYEDALVELKIASAKKEYSEAFWEIRNVFIGENLGKILLGIAIFVVLIIVIVILNKKTNIFDPVSDRISVLKNKKEVKDFGLMFKTLRHPLDSCYYLKTDKSISILNGLIIALILFIVYIIGLVGTNFIFSNVIIERTILLKEAFKLIIPISLFIVANYLTSSLLEGEGSFKGIVLTTFASFTPVIIIYPIAIIISNALTYSESVIYYILIVAMVLYTGCLLLVMNKELHNYTFKQMILNLIVTALLMVVLLIVCILCYLMVSQVYQFIKDIIREVMFND